jgi:hypothetical protein
MVKVEERPVFDRFIMKQYGKKVDYEEFELTNNLEYFRDLFQHVASEINGPCPPEVETDGLRYVFPCLG